MIKICWPKHSHPEIIFSAQTLYYRHSNEDAVNALSEGIKSVNMDNDSGTDMLNALKWKISSNTPTQHSHFRNCHSSNWIWIVRCMIYHNCRRKLTRWLIVMLSFYHLPYIARNLIYHSWSLIWQVFLSRRKWNGHMILCYWQRKFYPEMEWGQCHITSQVAFLRRWKNGCRYNKMQEI